MALRNEILRFATIDAMGQVALGIRSLLIKATIFFVMCALLVWALGGQLFPAPEIVDREPVSFNGETWFWRLYAGGDEPNTMHWSLMEERGKKPQPHDDARWAEAAALMVVDDALYYAGQHARTGDSDTPWVIGRVDTSGEERTWMLPDRLTLEVQLERLRKGLPLQDVDNNPWRAPGALDRPEGTADVTGTEPQGG